MADDGCATKGETITVLARKAERPGATLKLASHEQPSLICPLLLNPLGIGRDNAIQISRSTISCVSFSVLPSLQHHL